jgi:DNA-binding CsgD family transcriptional regulator
VSASTAHPRVAEFGLELAEILADGRTGTDPAPRLLDLLLAIGEAQAGILTACHAGSGRNRVAAVRGYSAALVDHLTSGAFQRDDPAYRALADDRQRPLRSWRDLDFDYATTPTAREFLLPAGVRGGISLRLVTRDGRYVGDLHMSTEDRRLPSPAAMGMLHRARMVLAACQDVRPLPDRLATLLPDAEYVALIGHDGRVRPLDGRGVGPADDERSRLLAALRAVVAADGANAPDRSYHWLDGAGAWHRVRIRPVRGGATVSTSRVPSPRGLSLRELQVLDTVCRGHVNVAIARQLQISERTVAHHVERILGKLHVGSRAAAVALAAQEGLRLIPQVPLQPNTEKRR